MRSLTLILFFAFISNSVPSYAWGHKAHQLIVQIAKSQLDQNVIENVDYYLKGMSWEDAACWMDSVKGESKYDVMKEWHYVNVEKDNTYVNNKNQNIIYQLTFCLNLFKNSRLLPMGMGHEKLKILFHLIADIHQPLHCGYSEDKGGSTAQVKFLGKESNLHKVWDSDLIAEKNIDIWACSMVMLGLSQNEKTEIQKIDVQAWMNESRLLLPQVYNFKNGQIDRAYIEQNAAVIKKQLTKAGLRLAAVLQSSFG